jgi:hypothetical protein
MKKSYILLLLFISISFSSCSNDNSESSDSSIKGYTFRLTSFKLSQVVDLNLDGIASIDMINEFDCIGDEEIYFGTIENQIIYKQSGFVGIIKNPTSGSDIPIDYYECSEENPNLSSSGNYIMVNKNIVEAEIKTIFGLGPKSYKVRYTIDSENKKLTETLTQSHPTTYNSQTHKWENSSIEIKKEFTRL